MLVLPPLGARAARPHGRTEVPLHPPGKSHLFIANWY